MFNNLDFCQKSILAATKRYPYEVSLWGRLNFDIHNYFSIAEVSAFALADTQKQAAGLVWVVSVAIWASASAKGALSVTWTPFRSLVPFRCLTVLCTVSSLHWLHKWGMACQLHMHSLVLHTLHGCCTSIQPACFLCTMCMGVSIFFGAGKLMYRCRVLEQWWQPIGRNRVVSHCVASGRTRVRGEWSDWKRINKSGLQVKSTDQFHEALQWSSKAWSDILPKCPRYW